LILKEKELVRILLAVLLFVVVFIFDLSH